MSKRIKKIGKNWSINIELTDSLIFVIGLLLGVIVGKL
jgi:hypothetical protein